MTKTAAALLALTLAGCQPPPPVPPPRFKPNPPYPPEIVNDTAAENPGEGYETTPPAEPTRPGEYPVASPTETPNEVISPFPPYNRIDVEGFQPGQLARDPSNNRIFRVP